MRILCVCYANICRSPMFAAILQRQLDVMAPEINHVVESAGISPEASQRACAAPHWEVLREETNIDLSAHRSRSYREVDLTEFDLIIVLDRNIYYSLESEVIKRGVEDRVHIIMVRDPWGQNIDSYRECYEAMSQEIAVFVEDKIPHPS